MFGREYFDGDVEKTLMRHEKVRKERIARVQDAGARARTGVRGKDGLVHWEEETGIVAD